MYPKISIVTACLNHAHYLEETMVSILGQGYPNLEYIIMDGGSTDGTIDIIKKYESRISYWVSEKDQGLYDALNKGFRQTSGEIMGWLNADDILHRNSLFTLAEIFSNHSSVEWLQGSPNVIDEKGRIVYHREHRSSKTSFFLKEYYDGIFIQQESTFWKRDLWEKAGSFISQDHKYASDFELWMRYFEHADLFNIDGFIGAFRVQRSGQLSSVNYAAYLKECDAIIDDCLNRLPETEIKKIKQIERAKKLKNTFPRLSKLLFISTYIQKAYPPKKFLRFNPRTQEFE